MSTKLPLIAQTAVFRKAGNSWEVLLLKRSVAKGGFWNVVNGTLEAGESLEDCRSRELLEETGIKEVLRWSDEVHRFYFPYKDFIMVVLAFAAEVLPDVKVELNKEHTEFGWMSPEKAAQLLKFDEDKKALRRAQQALSA